VYTPNASWLNWVESEFTALRYFTLDGSDYPSHAAQVARDRGLPALAQPPLPPQTPLRRQLEDPQARLPTQHCVTQH
jgi:hypothetical protein